MTTTNDTHLKDKSMKEKAVQTATQARHAAGHAASDAATHYVQEPAYDMVGLLRDYAKQKPDVAALWCFGIGFVLGWKLRP